MAARIRDDLGHLIEDTAMVAVGERRWPDPDLPPEETLELMLADYSAGAAEVDLAVLTPGLRLAPGDQGELLVRVTSGLASELHGEAQLVSPFGTWEMLGPWTQGFSIAPGKSTVLRFTAGRAGNRASRTVVGAGEGHVLRPGPVHRGDSGCYRAGQLTTYAAGEQIR